MSAFYTKPVTQLPGGLPFTEPRDGRKRYPGMEVSSEDEQISRIISWRQKNPTLYPEPEYYDFEKVRLELRKYQTDRLGNSKQFFVNGTGGMVPMEVRPATPKSVCSCGETAATPIYCKTCSSAKIKAWKCSACGKERKA